MQATLAELWIYPIKGCAGTRLKTVQALPTGLQHDRCMMVVDAATGRFITQRSHPKMALIKPIVQDDRIQLSGLQQVTLTLPLLSGEQVKTVTVWGDTLPAIDMGDEVAAWFTNALQTAVRLVRFDPAKTRAVKRLDKQTHQFADAYPYLVLSRASLQALNDRLVAKGAAAIGADRFRANIIINDVDAHTEDFVASMTHASGAIITVVAPCTRCQVPTINQTTGIADVQHEPTMTLNAYRYDSAEDGVTFGMNAVIDKTILLAQGDVLEIKLAF